MLKYLFALSSFCFAALTVYSGLDAAFLGGPILLPFVSLLAAVTTGALSCSQAQDDRDREERDASEGRVEL
jgi:hypothetical protein